MQSTDYIYEPLDMFKKQYRNEHAKNTSEYFEDLVKESGVNESENAQVVKKIRKKEKEIKRLEKKHRTQTGLKVFLIVLTVLLLIAGVALIDSFTDEKAPARLITGIIALAGGVGLILLIVLKLNKVIKNLNNLLSETKEKLDSLYATAWEQMRPLNELYDWSMTAAIIQKTMPLVKLDPYFDYRKFAYLAKKYGLPGNADKNKSVLFIQSGEILNNPFLLARILNFRMGTKTYRGTKIISWTVSRIVDGKTVTETRMQTLSATLTKPYPLYSTESFILYANDAAGDLSFNSDPPDLSGLNDRQIENLISRKEREIEKKARDAIKDNSEFTPLANTEFEALFNALDRDNEVQFRLLFTPLAQTEIIKLLKDKTEKYSSCWSLHKRKYLNFVFSKHLKKIDVSQDPSLYVDYDLASARKKFCAYNNDFFQILYFSLAPILAIPLYQQYRPREFIYDEDYYDKFNVSCWEHEATVNYFSESQFKHEKSVTRNILKTNVIAAGKDYDVLEVTAHGYEGIPRTDYVRVLGGDGHYHSVPVHWVEYLPVKKASRVVIKKTEGVSRREFINNKQNNDNWRKFIETHAGSASAFILRKSLLAFILAKPYDDQTDERLNEILYQIK